MPRDPGGGQFRQYLNIRLADMKEADCPFIRESIEATDGDLLDESEFAAVKIFLEPVFTGVVSSYHTPAPHRDISCFGIPSIHLSTNLTAPRVAT